MEPLDAFVLESQRQSSLNTNIDQIKLGVLEVPVKNTQVLNDDLLMPTYRQINILDQFNDQQPVFPYQGESSTLIHNTVKRPVPKRFPNPTFLPFEGSTVEFVSTVAQNVPFPGIGLIEEQSKTLTEAFFPVEHDSSILHEKQERLGVGVPFLEELSRYSVIQNCLSLLNNTRHRGYPQIIRLQRGLKRIYTFDILTYF